MKLFTKTTFYFTMSMVTLIVFISCKKNNSNQVRNGALGLPTVKLQGVTSSRTDSSKYLVIYNINSDGGSPIVESGVIWDTTHNISTLLSTKINGTVGRWDTISGLLPNEIYYLRAYATNANGTSYSDEDTISTNNFGPPTFNNSSVSNITVTGANFGTGFSSHGIPIYSSGLVYSTSPNPTLGTGITVPPTTISSGSMTLGLTGLAPLTTYYAKFYATNSFGTTYSSELVFTTLDDRTVYVCGDNSYGTAQAEIRGDGSFVSSPLYVYNRVQGDVAYSVFVSGTNVYIAGATALSADVWKNGVVTLSYSDLPFGYSECSAHAIFVSGSDVYVSGSAKDSLQRVCAIVWKNNTATRLTSQLSTTFPAIPKHIIVSGSVVYVVGQDNLQATLWKNGVPTYLTSRYNTNNANSVFISGSDVYVAGTDANRPTLWKNGIPTYLSSSGSAVSVAVLGSDIYVAGTGDTGGTLWKNGNAIPLAMDVISMCVSRNDVYVLGKAIAGSISQRNVVLWRNGIVLNFPNSSSFTPISMYVPQ